MKKLFYIGVLTALFLTACGEEEAKKPITEDKTIETPKLEDKVESKYPFPTSAPIGDATITVSTPAGDSTNGNIPTLFVSEEDTLTQIGIEYANFDGNYETFVYINEVFNISEQVGELSQSSLDLSAQNLKPGDYTVTAVQFTDNDPAKEPISLTQTKFKIEKSS